MHSKGGGGGLKPCDCTMSTVALMPIVDGLSCNRMTLLMFFFFREQMRYTIWPDKEDTASTQFRLSKVDEHSKDITSSHWGSRVVSHGNGELEHVKEACREAFDRYQAYKGRSTPILYSSLT